MKRVGFDRIFPTAFSASFYLFYLTPYACSSDLQRNIENLQKNSVTSLRTLVNLGSEVYMQADV